MINGFYNYIKKRSNNRLDCEVNLKIDNILKELVLACENAIYSGDYDKTYEIMETINQWKKVRGSKNTDVNLEFRINNSFITIFKYFDNL